MQSNYSQKIIDYFFKELQEKRLLPGDKLKSERELCELLGVSRPPLREALRALCIIGVFTTKQGNGTFVSDYNAKYLEGILRFTVVFSEELPNDYIQLRKALESEAARLAAIHATEEDLEDIRFALEEREQISKNHDPTTIRAELKKFDYMFHTSIAKASKNIVFLEFIKSISFALSVHQDITASRFKTPDLSNNFHRQIYYAIKSRQPEIASMIMYKHIESLEDVMLKQSFQSDVSPLQPHLDDNDDTSNRNTSHLLNWF